jgi:predicted ester cyclase
MKKMFFPMVITILLLAACNNEKKMDETAGQAMTDSTEMREEKNKETALASVKAFIAGDIDKTLQNVTADAIDYGDGSMPVIKGKDSIIVFVKQWREAFSDYKADNLVALADGDYVAIWGTWEGTFKTDFMRMKTAGKKIKINDVDIFKFNSEGKITEHRSIQSSAEMMKQLGGNIPK